MADDFDLDNLDDTEVGGDTGGDEPYGAQMLRKLHEDLSMIMEDYHNMMGPLEQTDVKDYMTGHLESVEEALSMTEELFGKAYPDLPSLSDASSEDGTMEGEEGKELETEETQAVSADSAEREDEPTGDEVIEGMETAEEEAETKSLHGFAKMHKVVKSFRKKHLCNGCAKKKGVCPECGKEPCACGKDLSADEPLSETTDTTRPDSAALHTKAFEDHERPVVEEAVTHLKDLGNISAMEDEHRMKSYHYHKRLEELSGRVGMKDHLPGDTATEANDGMDQLGQQGAMSLKGVRDVTPDMEDLSADDSDDMHAHRKAAMHASNYLAKMAYCKNFGEEHRSEAMIHAKALEDTSMPEEEAPVEVMDEEDANDNVTEPGELQEKNLKKLEAVLLGQLKGIDALSRQMASIGV